LFIRHISYYEIIRLRSKQKDTYVAKEKKGCRTDLGEYQFVLG